MIFVQKMKKSRRLFHNAYLFGYDNKENENPKTLKKSKVQVGCRMLLHGSRLTRYSMMMAKSTTVTTAAAAAVPPAAPTLTALYSTSQSSKRRRLLFSSAKKFRGRSARATSDSLLKLARFGLDFRENRWFIFLLKGDRVLKSYSTFET